MPMICNGEAEDWIPPIVDEYGLNVAKVSWLRQMCLVAAESRSHANDEDLWEAVMNDASKNSGSLSSAM